MPVEEARQTPIAEKANIGEKSRSGFTVEVGFKTAGLAMNTHRGRRPARRYKIPGVRVVKIWAVLTYPIAALSSWFELDGVPGPLAKTAFERAAEKLPIKVKVVARLGETLVEED